MKSSYLLLVTCMVISFYVPELSVAATIKAKSNIPNSSISNYTDSESESESDYETISNPHLFSFRSIINYFRGHSFEDEMDYDGYHEGAYEYNYDNPDSNDEESEDEEENTDDDNDNDDIVNENQWSHDDNDDCVQMEGDSDDDSESENDADYYNFDYDEDDSDYEFYKIHGMQNNAWNKTKKRGVRRRTEPQVVILNNTSKANSTIEIKIEKPDDQEILSVIKNATDTVLKSKGFSRVIAGVNDVIYEGLSKAANSANFTEMSKWYTLYNIILEAGPKNFITTLTTDAHAKEIVKDKIKNGAAFAQQKVDAVENFRKNVKKLVKTDQLVSNINVSSKKAIGEASKAFSLSKVWSFFTESNDIDNDFEVVSNITYHLFTNSSFNWTDDCPSNKTNSSDDDDDVIDGAPMNICSILPGIILATIICLIV
ncbi:uncharacterized protein RJT21DRAFT_58910 [Scheffersomyces amazonensis]|uniref:uncharacterized protein n=1 Tax=Scheffersomyces amazonensis TaxID=1078765 RepID=UPI00315D399F